jgi:hypothetical protein
MKKLIIAFHNAANAPENIVLRVVILCICLVNIIWFTK